MVRYKNRLSKMDEDRLPVKVYKWMESLKVKGWVQDLKHVLNYVNMDDCMNLCNACDLDVFHARAKVLNRDKWWLEAGTKTKLDTFRQIFDRKDPQGLIKCNLSRNQRSVVTRLKCGVLPLMVEVGRFKNTPREKRTCPCCTDKPVETEVHFVTECDAFEQERNDWFAELAGKVDTVNLKGERLLREVLSNEVIKVSARHLEHMFEVRKNMIYEVVDSTNEQQVEPQI